MSQYPSSISENNYLALTGAEAAAEAMRQIEPGVVPVYPITPQTPIIEKFAAYAASGKVKSEIITAESEHSVLSAAIGAAAAGSRSMTATSSVGLALMYEILGIASGMRLPIVMNVANRALSSPINIHCDHSDSMGVRDCGWAQIYSESAQEVYDHTILAVRLAEHQKVMLPVIVAEDGFVTSHLLERVEILSDNQVKKFVGEYGYPNSFFAEGKNLTCGSLMLPSHYFETKVSQLKGMENARKAYKEVADELESISGRSYREVELFQIDKDTEGIIITMSSAAGTAKEVARKLYNKGHKVGVVKVRLFRPFPYEELGAVIKNVANIAVLDRALSCGSVPPLYSEVIQTLFVKTRYGAFLPEDKNIQSYVFGLGGRDLREKDVKDVYADILTNKFSNESKFINLNPRL